MKNSSALTLLEVVLVVSLCIGVMLYTLPQLALLRRRAVHMELQTLHATLVYLQQCAQASAIQQTLICDPTQHSYSYQDTKHRLSAAVKFGIPYGIKGPPSSPTHDITHPITYVHNRIVCTCQGTMTPGTLYLTDTDEQFVYALTIPVGDISHVRTYVYDGAWRIIT